MLLFHSMRKLSDSIFKISNSVDRKERNNSNKNNDDKCIDKSLLILSNRAVVPNMSMVIQIKISLQTCLKYAAL